MIRRSQIENLTNLERKRTARDRSGFTRRNGQCRVQAELGLMDAGGESSLTQLLGGLRFLIRLDGRRQSHLLRH